MSRRRQGTGNLFRHGRCWWMRYWVAGQQVAENTRTEDRATAEAILKRRMGEVTGGLIDAPPGRATISELCGLVLADYELRKLRDRVHIVSRTKVHIEPHLGKIRAVKLTNAQIRGYIQQRRQEGAADGSINRELAIVRRAFTLAMREEPPLVKQVPYIPMLEENNVRQGFLERETYEVLLEHVPLALKALYVCAYHVGTRKGELRKARWEQIDWEANLIRLEKSQTKGKRPRTLPIYGDMRMWLNRQQEACPEGHPFVFFGRGKRPVSKDLQGWAEACEKAGVPGLLFHDLRRSAVRNMKRAGVQDTVAMAISGHRTRSVFDRYNITDEGDLGNAGEKLESYFQERKRARAAKLERVK